MTMVVTERESQVGWYAVAGGRDGLFTFCVAKVIEPPRYNAH
jgi:hypothetical protein